MLDERKSTSINLTSFSGGNFETHLVAFLAASDSATQNSQCRSVNTKKCHVNFFFHFLGFSNTSEFKIPENRSETFYEISCRSDLLKISLAFS
jgi:hypothetical protein